MKQNKFVVAGVLAVVLAAGIFVVVNGANAGSGAFTGQTPNMIKQDKAMQTALKQAELLGIQNSDRAIGNSSSNVTVIEYASLTCSHCADFHNKNFKEFKKNYIDTGKVSFTLRPMPWDNIAVGISQVMFCAPKSKYYQFADAFFSTQKSWIKSKTPLEEIKKIARLGGMGPKQVEDCLKNQAVYDEMNQVVKDGKDVLKVNSTPMFFINGTKMSGVHTAKQLGDVIDGMLAKQKK